jgi:hypothetical protein
VVKSVRLVGFKYGGMAEWTKAAKLSCKIRAQFLEGGVDTHRGFESLSLRQIIWGV